VKVPTVEILETAPGKFAVRGDLTFATARRAREQGLQAFSAREGDMEVDCTGIGASDSAGLAVLLDWLAFAHRNGKTMRFTGVPPEIRAVARISEVEDLLG